MRFEDETLRAQASVADGPRRAALMLHSISPADRSWILAQLRMDQREAINGLLEELNQLGIPREVGLIEPAAGGLQVSKAVTLQVEQTVTQDSAADGLKMKARYSRLANADPHILAPLLLSEPARLVALLLRIHNWSWHQDLLEQVGIVKRRQIESAVAEMAHQRTSAVAPKLADALLTNLENLLSMQVGVLPMAVPQKAGYLSRVKRAFGGKKKKEGVLI